MLAIALIKLSVKADLILHKLRINYPPSEETVRRIFGEDGKSRKISGERAAAT